MSAVIRFNTIRISYGPSHISLFSQHINGSLYRSLRVFSPSHNKLGRSLINQANWKASLPACFHQDTADTAGWTIPDAPFELQMNWQAKPSLKWQTQTTPQKLASKNKLRFFVWWFSFALVSRSPDSPTFMCLAGWRFDWLIVGLR